MSSAFSANLRLNLLLIYSLLCVVFVSGTVYGWPALRAALLAEGVLAARCQSQDRGVNEHMAGKRCREQDIALGAVFAAGSWTVQGGRFFFGIMRDACGTRTTVAVSGMLAAVGAVVLATAAENDLASFAVAFALVGLGSGSQLALQPVAALFPRKRSTVTGFLSAAFQVSGGVFTVITWPASGYESSNTRLISFTTYSAAVVVFVAIGWVVLPRGPSYAELLPSSKQEPPLPAKGVDDDNAATDDPPAVAVVEAAAPLYPLEHLGLREQLLSVEYLLLSGWFALVFTCCQYHVISIGDQLEEMRVSDANRLSRLYTVVYACVFPLAPMAGRLADSVGYGPVTVGLTTSVAVAFAFLHSSSDVVQLVGFVLVSGGRLMLFAIYFAHMNSIFGFRFYGALAGGGLLASSLVALVQYPLLSWGLTSGFAGPNALGAGVSAVSALYGVYVCVRESKMRKFSYEVSSERDPPGA